MRRETLFYSRLLPERATCFDVGAHLGTKVEALLRTGSRVIAIEPEPICVRHLLHQFGHDPRFHCVPKGVAARSGKLTLYVSRDSRSTTSFRPGWGEGSTSPVEVDVTTLDELISQHGVPEYCKIDVEGYELEVLRGLSHRIPLVSFEFHCHELDEAFLCLAELARLGELRINVTPQDSAQFICDHWYDLPSLTDFLRGKWSSGRRGDLYVQIR